MCDNFLLCRLDDKTNQHLVFLDRYYNALRLKDAVRRALSHQRSLKGVGHALKGLKCETPLICKCALWRVLLSSAFIKGNIRVGHRLAIWCDHDPTECDRRVPGLKDKVTER
jgi:hypothetical protein